MDSGKIMEVGLTDFNEIKNPKSAFGVTTTDTTRLPSHTNLEWGTPLPVCGCSAGVRPIPSSTLLRSAQLSHPEGSIMIIRW